MSELKDLNTEVGVWSVFEIESEKVKYQEEGASLVFDVKKKSIHGRTGCNFYNATFNNISTQSNSMTINDGMMTRMYCLDDQLETRLLETLKKVATFDVNGDTLSLNDADGKAVVRLQIVQRPQE